MTNTQRSRLALLKLVCIGGLAVPAFAATGGLTVFGADPGSTPVALLDAPPPIVFMALGLATVAFVVGRRLRKGAAEV